MSRPRCYGEMMAHAAGEGFDSPEAYASAMRSRRELERAAAAEGLAGEYSEDAGESADEEGAE